MNKLITSALLLGSLALGGCTTVVSSLPTTNTVNGDAWYSTQKMFSSKVYYCPAPTSAGPATCTEAKMVEGK